MFETDEDRTYFLIRLPIHAGFTEVEQARKNATPGVTAEVAAEVAAEVKGHVILMLRELDGEMGRTQLMEKLGLKHAEHFRLNYLNPGLEKGFIEMTIPGKPRSRLQKYRLTQLGGAVLAALTDKR